MTHTETLDAYKEIREATQPLQERVGNLKKRETELRTIIQENS